MIFDRRFLERLNRQIPHMHYADGTILGAWTNLDDVTELDVRERISRRPISEGEAKSIFRMMKKLFRLKRSSLHLLDAFCPTPPCASRDMADADLRTHEIRMSRRALTLGEGQFAGLLGHELGHLADPTPNASGAERRADRIGSKFMGVPIRYDRCDLQTIGPGRVVRPEYLHQ